MSEAPTWKLKRFNPIRAIRGAFAAEVEFVIDGTRYLLWMDRKTIGLNIEQFGDHPELQKALEHYRTKEAYP